MTCVFVVIGVVVFTADTVRRVIVASEAAATARTEASAAKAEASAAKAEELLKNTPRHGEVDQSASTNVDAAHVTLTNLNNFPVEACFKAVITPNDSSGLRAESVAVCSGIMKPRTSVALIAPYRVGAVEKLCSGSPDGYGNKHIDWSKCTFDTMNISPKEEPPAKVAAEVPMPSAKPK